VRPLKGEVKAVSAALQEEHDSVEEAAEAAIAALDQARVGRTLFGVAIQGIPCAFIYQPFGNKQEALQWIKKNAVGVDAAGLSVGVVPLLSRERPPQRRAEAQAELDKARELETPKPATRRRRG